MAKDRSPPDTPPADRAADRAAAPSDADTQRSEAAALMDLGNLQDDSGDSDGGWAEAVAKGAGEAEAGPGPTVQDWTDVVAPDMAEDDDESLSDTDAADRFFGDMTEE